jgi:hypothetical protein
VDPDTRNNVANLDNAALGRYPVCRPVSCATRVLCKQCMKVVGLNPPSPHSPPTHPRPYPRPYPPPPPTHTHTATATANPTQVRDADHRSDAVWLGQPLARLRVCHLWQLTSFRCDDRIGDSKHRFWQADGIFHVSVPISLLLLTSWLPSTYCPVLLMLLLVASMLCFNVSQDLPGFANATSMHPIIFFCSHVPPPPPPPPHTHTHIHEQLHSHIIGTSI